MANQIRNDSQEAIRMDMDNEPHQPIQPDLRVARAAQNAMQIDNYNPFSRNVDLAQSSLAQRYGNPPEF